MKSEQLLSSLLCMILLNLTLCLAHTHHPQLLLISFDGFRWDYLDVVKKLGAKTPNFDRLIANGVLSTVKNSFVTKTFPNHYTMATGLYEENHGVVANNMYDPVFNEEFDNLPDQNTDVRWWDNGTESWTGQPIWFANEKAGAEALVKRGSGVFFWPGHFAEIRGQTLARNIIPYNRSIPLEQRINTVVDWFIDHHNPVNFVALYYEDPDDFGHSSGPSNESLSDVIVYIDKHVGILIEKLEANNLFAEMNLIITSDHGMVDIIGTKYLSDYVNTSLFDHYGHTPVFNILPKPGEHDTVYKALKQAPDLHVFLKEDIPRDYHYTYNRRIQPIVVSAPEGYNICINKTDCSAALHSKGNHGYNNSISKMHPIFIGHGPGFRSGHKSHSTFNNVDLYPLMCHLLEIDAPPNDGDMDNVKHLLAKHDNSTMTLLTYMLSIAFVATIAGIITVAALRIQRIHRHKHQLLITPPHMNSAFDHKNTGTESQLHLLTASTSDEEEIP